MKAKEKAAKNRLFVYALFCIYATLANITPGLQAPRCQLVGELGLKIHILDIEVQDFDDFKKRPNRYIFGPCSGSYNAGETAVLRELQEGFKCTGDISSHNFSGRFCVAKIGSVKIQRGIWGGRKNFLSLRAEKFIDSTPSFAAPLLDIEEIEEAMYIL